MTGGFRIKVDLSQLPGSDKRTSWFFVGGDCADVGQLKAAIFTRFQLPTDELSVVELWLDDCVIPDCEPVSLLKSNDYVALRSVLSPAKEAEPSQLPAPAAETKDISENASEPPAATIIISNVITVAEDFEDDDGTPPAVAAEAPQVETTEADEPLSERCVVRHKACCFSSTLTKDIRDAPRLMLVVCSLLTSIDLKLQDVGRIVNQENVFDLNVFTFSFATPMLPLLLPYRNGNGRQSVTEVDEIIIDGDAVPMNQSDSELAVAAEPAELVVDDDDDDVNNEESMGFEPQDEYYVMSSVETIDDAGVDSNSGDVQESLQDAKAEDDITEDVQVEDAVSYEQQQQENLSEISSGPDDAEQAAIKPTVVDDSAERVRRNRSQTNYWTRRRDFIKKMQDGSGTDKHAEAEAETGSTSETEVVEIVSGEQQDSETDKNEREAENEGPKASTEKKCEAKPEAEIVAEIVHIVVLDQNKVDAIDPEPEDKSQEEKLPAPSEEVHEQSTTIPEKDIVEIPKTIAEEDDDDDIIEVIVIRKSAPPVTNEPDIANTIENILLADNNEDRNADDLMPVTIKKESTASVSTTNAQLPSPIGFFTTGGQKSIKRKRNKKRNIQSAAVQQHLLQQEVVKAAAVANSEKTKSQWTTFSIDSLKTFRPSVTNQNSGNPITVLNNRYVVPPASVSSPLTSTAAMRLFGSVLRPQMDVRYPLFQVPPRPVSLMPMPIPPPPPMYHQPMPPPMGYVYYPPPLPVPRGIPFSFKPEARLQPTSVRTTFHMIPPRPCLPPPIPRTSNTDVDKGGFWLSSDLIEHRAAPVNVPSPTVARAAPVKRVYGYTPEGWCRRSPPSSPSNASATVTAAVPVSQIARMTPQIGMAAATDRDPNRPNPAPIDRDVQRQKPASNRDVQRQNPAPIDRDVQRQKPASNRDVQRQNPASNRDVQRQNPASNRDVQLQNPASNRDAKRSSTLTDRSSGVKRKSPPTEYNERRKVVANRDVARRKSPSRDVLARRKSPSRRNSPSTGKRKSSPVARRRRSPVPSRCQVSPSLRRRASTADIRRKDASTSARSRRTRSQRSSSDSRSNRRQHKKSRSRSRSDGGRRRRTSSSSSNLGGGRRNRSPRRRSHSISVSTITDDDGGSLVGGGGAARNMDSWSRRITLGEARGRNSPSSLDAFDSRRHPHRSSLDSISSSSNQSGFRMDHRTTAQEPLSSADLEALERNFSRSHRRARLDSISSTSTLDLTGVAGDYGRNRSPLDNVSSMSDMEFNSGDLHRRLTPPSHEFGFVETVSPSVSPREVGSGQEWYDYHEDEDDVELTPEPRYSPADGGLTPEFRYTPPNDGLFLEPRYSPQDGGLAPERDYFPDEGLAQESGYGLSPDRGYSAGDGDGYPRDGGPYSQEEEEYPMDGGYQTYDYPPDDYRDQSDGHYDVMGGDADDCEITFEGMFRPSSIESRRSWERNDFTPPTPSPDTRYRPSTPRPRGGDYQDTPGTSRRQRESVPDGGTRPPPPAEQTSRRRSSRFDSNVWKNVPPSKSGGTVSDSQKVRAIPATSSHAKTRATKRHQAYLARKVDSVSTRGKQGPKTLPPLKGILKLAKLRVVPNAGATVPTAPAGVLDKTDKSTGITKAAAAAGENIEVAARAYAKMTGYRPANDGRTAASSSHKSGDYSSYPILEGSPRVYDVIAYKEYEMDETSAVEDTEYKVGKVVAYDSLHKEVLLEFPVNLTGKVSGHESDSEEFIEEVAMDMTCFAEVRVISRKRQ